MKASGARPYTPPTKRNLEVLAAVLTGTREDAAQKLGLHRTTVREHIRTLCIRLQVRDRVEAARVLGWLRIPPDLLTGADRSVPSSRSDDDTAPVVRRVAV